MKQLFISAIAVLLSTTIVQSQTIVTAAETLNAPTIDGIISASEWDNATIFDFQGTNGFEFVGESASTSAADFSGSFRVMWDATNLYLLFEINDDTNQWDSGGDWNDTYQDDSIEVYLDINNTGSGELNNGDGIFQYRFGLDGTASTIDGYPTTSTGGSWWEDTQTFPTTSGMAYDYTLAGVGANFIMEVVIPWADPNADADTDFAASIGASLGFTLAYNDDDNGNNRDAQHWWMSDDNTGSAWNDAGQWGTLELAAVPEPSQYAFAFGLISLGFIVYKKRKTGSIR